MTLNYGKAEINTERFFSYIGEEDEQGCRLWSRARDECGYGLFNVKIDGKYYCTTATRVMWFLKTGEEPGAKKVCHICDNPPCTNFSHLWLGTARDNTIDAYEKGRLDNYAAHHYVVGHRGYGAQLSDQDVKDIIARMQGGEGNTSIAYDYHIDRSVISRIRHGRRYVGVVDVDDVPKFPKQQLALTCRKGHPYTLENTRVNKTSGRRFCVMCAIQNKRDWRVREKANA